MTRWITFDAETAEALHSNLDAVSETRAGDALQAAVESQNAVVLLPAGEDGVLLVRLQRRRDLPIEAASEEAVPHIERAGATTRGPVSAVLEMEPEHRATIETAPGSEITSSNSEWTEQDATPLPEARPWYEAPAETVVETRPQEEWSHDATTGGQAAAASAVDLPVDEEPVPYQQAEVEDSISEPDSMRFAAGGLLGLRDEPVYEEEKPKKWWQRILE